MRIHSRQAEYENYEFITSKDKGRYVIELVKFLKKGVMLINREYALAYWVEYAEENEVILQPDTWGSLIMVATSTETYLESVTSSSPATVEYSVKLKGFTVTRPSDE